MFRMNCVSILYENDEIYVINKPSGLAVQGGQGVAHSLDVDFSKQVGAKVYLVHRLDKDTAGLMIVAKTPAAANKWTKLIGSKVAHKEYVAVCAGSINPKKGVIKDDVVQHGDNKTAVTYYNVEKEWDVNYQQPDGQEGQAAQVGQAARQGSVKMSQFRLLLDTGRMHQIRIHLAKQGCPIAGDDQHGNFKVNKILKKTLKVKKLLLASVKLTMPLEGKEQTFEIDLPDYMKF